MRIWCLTTRALEQSPLPRIQLASSSLRPYLAHRSFDRASARSHDSPPARLNLFVPRFERPRMPTGTRNRTAYLQHVIQPPSQVHLLWHVRACAQCLQPLIVLGFAIEGELRLLQATPAVGPACSSSHGRRPIAAPWAHRVGSLSPLRQVTLGAGHASARAGWGFEPSRLGVEYLEAQMLNCGWLGRR